MPLSSLSKLVVGSSITLVIVYLCMLLFPRGMGAAFPLVLSTTYMNNFFIWTVLTCAFTETSFIKVCFDIAILVWISVRFGPLEELSDSFRLAALTVVTALGSALITSIIIFVGFVVTRWENLFFSPTYGYGGILMAYLVLLTQRLPTERVFGSSGAGGTGGMSFFRVQHLPFTWLCLSALLRLVLPAATTSTATVVMDFPLVANAFVISWVYLRFFQHNSDGSVGDTTEDFQFIGLFPRVSFKSNACG